MTTSSSILFATSLRSLRFARGPGVLVVHPSLAANSVPELIADAQRSPGKITVASAGIGSAPHMYWELFRSLSGVDMLHVPYRGGGPALTDLLGGQVQIVLRDRSVLDWICQGGKAARFGGYQRNTRRGVA